MNIEFLATVAVIAPDPMNSRSLYVDALGLPLQGEGDGYYHSEQIAGCKSFGIWPLSQAAQACFGTEQMACGATRTAGQHRVRRAQRRRCGSCSTRTRSRPDMICCTKPERNHGVRQSPGCSHPRAQ